MLISYRFYKNIFENFNFNKNLYITYINGINIDQFFIEWKIFLRR